ncbi:MAG: amidoligase family protein [Armatimonadota bacterium]
MKLQELRFGIEIETIKRERGTVARAIQSVVGGEVSHVAGSSSYDPWEVRDDKNRVWKVVADSSLASVAAHLRAEIVSPVLCYEDIADLQEVVRAVRRCGAQVDEKCGLHIHVGTEEFGGKALTNLAKTFYKYEPLIIAALGVSEQRMRQYTKPLSDDFIARLEKLRARTRDQVNKAWYGALQAMG